jgi:hypothetical protein
MVEEVRKIMLSMDEIKAAYEAYRVTAPGFLPEGTILGCQTREDAVIVSIDASSSDTKKQYEVILRGIDVLRPLIRFCIENSIMLPRDGKKSVLIDKTRIVLVIELTMHPESMSRSAAILSPVAIVKASETVVAVN